MTHLSNRSLALWHRFSDRVAAAWTKLIDGVAGRWYWLTDRLAARSTRVRDPWHRFSDRVAAGWTRFADRVADRWYRLTDLVAAGWTRFADRVADRWYRLTDLVAAGRTRLSIRISERDGFPFRGPVLVVGTLCVLLAISAIVLIRPGLDSPSPGDTATDTPGTDTPGASVASNEDPARRGLSATNNQLPEYDVHVNEGGGYLFSYPGTWEIASAGNNARLVSPDGDVVMTFLMAPPGSLEEASDRVLGNVTGSYSGVELVAGDVERTPQGLRSFVVGGDALNATGTSVRFLVITIQGPEENWAITVRFSPSADPLETLPAIQEIVSSFRISQAE
jgi:hypothetical protein